MKRLYPTLAIFFALNLLYGCAADDPLQRGELSDDECVDNAFVYNPSPFASIAQADCPDPDVPDDTERPVQISFTNTVNPSLQKCAGCHTGGTGGWTYDGGAQAHAQVTGAVDITDAANSALLLKAINESAHGGGPQFEKDSEDYRSILAWIESGAPDN